MKATDSHLSEITRVEFIHQNSVVVLTTGITTTTGVASVLAHTAVTSGDVATFLAVLVKVGRLYLQTRIAQ